MKRLEKLIIPHFLVALKPNQPALHISELAKSLESDPRVLNVSLELLNVNTMPAKGKAKDWTHHCPVCEYFYSRDGSDPQYCTNPICLHEGPIVRIEQAEWSGHGD